jgi:alpha-1,3-mannosyltransferase
MISVVQVSHRFWPCLGGVESHVRQLCENLKRKGFVARVVCLDRCPNSPEKLLGKETVSGIEVSRLGFFDLGFYRVAPGVLWKLGDAEIVHVHGLGFFSDFLALKKLFHGKRLVLSTHGGVFHTGSLGLLKKIYFFGWCRLALRAFDRVVAVSRADYELFSKILPKEKLVLVENPVDARPVSGGKRQRSSFLFVGRLSKNKGLFELLEAFALAKAESPGFVLRIVGKGFDLSERQLKERALELGLEKHVEVLGEVSDKGLAKLYAKSEFFVSGSSYEGFGITALEAMGSGLVPVLNDIPTFRSFVQDSGAGFLADFSGREKGAGAILAAMSLAGPEKEKLASRARAFAGLFSWERNIARFEEVYRGVLGKK